MSAAFSSAPKTWGTELIYLLDARCNAWNVHPRGGCLDLLSVDRLRLLLRNYAREHQIHLPLTCN